MFFIAVRPYLTEEEKMKEKKKTKKDGRHHEPEMRINEKEHKWKP